MSFRRPPLSPGGLPSVPTAFLSVILGTEDHHSHYALFEDMRIISIIFSGLMIIAGYGKLAAIRPNKKSRAS
jgi:hypothetical protein